jgi:hypothetical protein
MINQRDQVVEQLKLRFGTMGLSAEWYVIPDFEGFAPVVGGQPIDVHCVEVYLGPSPTRPGYGSYAVVQTFLPDYPSLGITFLTELRDSDRLPSTEPAKFSIEVDKKFSTIFLPVLFTAFNELDPTGQQRGVLVQSYNSELTLGDFVQASAYSGKLVSRYKQDGQLALIAVDYYDPLSTLIANVMKLTTRLFGGDVHLITRTKQSSDIKIPIRNTQGRHHFIGNHSTALDEGIALARRYLDKHYRTYNYIPKR